MSDKSEGFSFPKNSSDEPFDLWNATASTTIENQKNGTTTENNLFHDDIFRFITEGVLLTMVSTFGLVGNAMSIYVLTNAAGVTRHGGASFSRLLRGLATFDAMFLVIAIISFGIPSLSKWYAKNVFLYMTPIVFGLLHTFRVGSVYVTLAVTFERFHAIICPLKHFMWKKYLLPGAITITIAYNIPKFFEMELTAIHFQKDPITNMTVVKSSAMRTNPIYMSLYVFWSKFIFIEIIPYVTIMVMNIFIIIKISKSSKYRRQFRRHDDVEDVDEAEVQSSDRINNDRLSHDLGSVQPRRTFVKKQQEEHSLAVILIGMSTLFIFCQSFKIVPDLYELIVCRNSGNLGHNCAMSKIPVMNVIMRLSHFLVCFNSSTNFLIYYLNGKKFRKAWIETYGVTFCCKSAESAGPTAVPMSTLISHRVPTSRNLSVPNRDNQTTRRNTFAQKLKTNPDPNDITVVDEFNLKSENAYPVVEV